ncbi:hypothetical protein BDW22DRAFT_649211 [Trametopsis cervina]|nr:hypothetical protein BDW22DRAFT_649211 [Trametopsis cervina]
MFSAASCTDVGCGHRIVRAGLSEMMGVTCCVEDTAAWVASPTSPLPVYNVSLCRQCINTLACFWVSAPQIAALHVYTAVARLEQAVRGSGSGSHRGSLFMLPYRITGWRPDAAGFILSLIVNCRPHCNAVPIVCRSKPFEIILEEHAWAHNNNEPRFNIAEVDNEF